VSIPEGNYTANELLTTIQDQFDAGLRDTFGIFLEISLNVSTAKITITNTGLANYPPPSGAVPTANAEPTSFTFQVSPPSIYNNSQGLGYNLGYAKVDTPFSTYHRADSFYKILDDYIFLRLNPEYQLNRMDNTFRENFKITRDSTGQIQNFHGKLLLNNFNTFSTTFLFNDQTFNPPIGRLDQMYFEWVDVVGQQIDNDNCDWSATLVIKENKPSATTASTLPALPPMNFPRK
jgi:hypothetical protein